MQTTKEYGKCFNYNKIISVSSPPPGKQEDLCDLFQNTSLMSFVKSLVAMNFSE
jgi:hypothetical protein